MLAEASKEAAGEDVDTICCQQQQQQQQQQQDKPSAPLSEIGLSHLDSEVQAIMTRLGMEPLLTGQNAGSESSAQAGEIATDLDAALDQPHSSGEDSMLNVIMARLGRYHVQECQQGESAQGAAW